MKKLLLLLVAICTTILAGCQHSPSVETIVETGTKPSSFVTTMPTTSGYIPYFGLDAATNNQLSFYYHTQYEKLETEPEDKKSGWDFFLSAKTDAAKGLYDGGVAIALSPKDMPFEKFKHSEEQAMEKESHNGIVKKIIQRPNFQLINGNFWLQYQFIYSGSNSITTYYTTLVEDHYITFFRNEYDTDICDKVCKETMISSFKPEIPFYISYKNKKTNTSFQYEGGTAAWLGQDKRAFTKQINEVDSTTLWQNVPISGKLQPIPAIVMTLEKTSYTGFKPTWDIDKDIWSAKGDKFLCNLRTSTYSGSVCESIKTYYYTTNTANRVVSQAHVANPYYVTLTQYSRHINNKTLSFLFVDPDDGEIDYCDSICMGKVIASFEVSEDVPLETKIISLFRKLFE